MKRTSRPEIERSPPTRSNTYNPQPPRYNPGYISAYTRSRLASDLSLDETKEGQIVATESVLRNVIWQVLYPAALDDTMGRLPTVSCKILARRLPSSGDG